MGDRIGSSLSPRLSLASRKPHLVLILSLLLRSIPPAAAVASLHLISCIVCRLCRQTATASFSFHAVGHPS